MKCCVSVSGISGLLLFFYNLEEKCTLISYTYIATVYAVRIASSVSVPVFGELLTNFRSTYVFVLFCCFPMWLLSVILCGLHGNSFFSHFHVHTMFLIVAQTNTYTHRHATDDPLQCTRVSLSASSSIHFRAPQITVHFEFDSHSYLTGFHTHHMKYGLFTFFFAFSLCFSL